MFTRHREEFRFHLAPLRNHFQIVPVKVTVSHIFGPVSCERKCYLSRFKPHWQQKISNQIFYVKVFDLNKQAIVVRCYENARCTF